MWTNEQIGEVIKFFSHNDSKTFIKYFPKLETVGVYTLDSNERLKFFIGFNSYKDFERIKKIKLK